MPRARRRRNADSEPATESTADNTVTDIEPIGADGKRTEDARDKEERVISEYKARIRNPVTAIRAMCVECFGGSPRSVADCPSEDCSLWPFRMGKNTMHSRAKNK